MIKRILILGLTAFLFQTCYYDKLNELHISSVDACDTTVAATYSKSVSVVIAANCISCHSGSSPSGIIKLESYSDVTDIAKSGLLTGTIRHESGQQPMPPDSKIRDCEIQKIETWISNGFPEN